VDADSLEIVATLDSVGFPIRVAMTPDGRHALVTNARAATLSVFDVAERALVATVQVADPAAEYRQTLLGDAALPIGIEVHPDGERRLRRRQRRDEVAVIEHRHLGGRRPLGHGPRAGRARRDRDPLAWPDQAVSLGGPASADAGRGAAAPAAVGRPASGCWPSTA
jgi:hypothetical protein